MKRFFCFVSVILAGALVLSCKDGKEEAEETAQLGVQVKNAQDIYEIPEHQTITLELLATADPTSAEAYTITLGANPGLVAIYNASKGTSCVALPVEAYSFVSNSVILPRYTAKSNSCQIKIKASGCEAGKDYLLPVAIDGVKGGSNFLAPDEKAAYIRVKVTETTQEGDGSASNPYIVNSVETLLDVGKLLKDNGTVYFKMTEDVDLSSVSFSGDNAWTPINYTNVDEEKDAARKRKIVFDGNNHKIIGFKAGGPLFGILCGSVQDLTFEGAEINSDTDDGAVVVGVAGASEDENSFAMKNVKVLNSTVKSDYKRAGALVAHMRDGKVDACEASCPVVAQQQGGGLIGRVDAGTITGCSASGNVTTDAYYAGGLIGLVGKATIKDCHASGNATSLLGSPSRVGGLVGTINGDSSLENCWASGNAKGEGFYGGGLVGIIESPNLGDKDNPRYNNVLVTINKCYSTGDVTLPDTGTMAHAGGFLGNISSIACVDISNCYSTGKVVCSRYSGGFVGSIYAFDDVASLAPSREKLTITNCYTTSDVSGIKSNVGIVYARAWSANASISCKGFVAKSVEGVPFVFPADDAALVGNYYGNEGTISSQASALGWDSSIWDLSGALPKLK